MFRTLLLALLVCSAVQAQTVGLQQYTSEAYPGYTLMSNNEVTYLIDNDGQVVNRWESAYKTGHGLYLLANGNLLRAGAADAALVAGGSGGIIELFSWDGRLLWSYRLNNASAQQHHDLAPLPNGNFLCTVWERKSEAEARLKGRMHAGEVWAEKILEVKMLPDDEAEIVWEWSVWDHLVQESDPDKEGFGRVKDHPELLDINYVAPNQPASGNWLHFNAIDYHPGFDQVIVSSRFLSEVYVIDHATSTEEAAGPAGDILFRYGNPRVHQAGTAEDQELFGPHDIRWVEEGASFMVFNNEFLPGRQSEVRLFNNPVQDDGSYAYREDLGYGNTQTLRSYRSPEIYSDILSGAEILPNGNWLILAGRTGLLTELNPQDEIVWKYVYPVNRNGGPAVSGAEPRFKLLFRAKRYPLSYPAFSNRSLLPRGPVELTGQTENPRISLINTLATDALLVDNQLNNFTPAEIFLFDLNGQLVYRNELIPGLNRITVSGFSEGVYLALVRQGERFLLQQRWLKY